MRADVDKPVRGIDRPGTAQVSTLVERAYHCRAADGREQGPTFRVVGERRLYASVERDGAELIPAEPEAFNRDAVGIQDEELILARVESDRGRGLRATLQIDPAHKFSEPRRFVHRRGARIDKKQMAVARTHCEIATGFGSDAVDFELTFDFPRGSIDDAHLIPARQPKKEMIGERIVGEARDLVFRLEIAWHIAGNVRSRDRGIVDFGRARGHRIQVHRPGRRAAGEQENRTCCARQTGPWSQRVGERRF